MRLKEYQIIARILRQLFLKEIPMLANPTLTCLISGQKKKEAPFR